MEEVSENNDTSSDEDDDVIKDNLLSHIQKKINKGQYFCLPTNETTVCKCLKQFVFVRLSLKIVAVRSYLGVAHGNNFVYF